VEPALVQSPYLSAFLRSAFGQAAMGARATGALHPHLEAGVKTVPVLLPPIDAQVALANEVDTQRDHYAELSEHLRRSIAKLREYKQSLITAAVTGEIDVTTAGGGIPG
jgi:type I restriction enzyme S subunit